MQRNVVILQLVIFTIGLTSSANILDLLYWDIEKGSNIGKRDEIRETSDGEKGNSKSCECSGPSCMCCVDFNITFIDLGGPGCVNMKYLSQNDGLMVNVSYGESLLHSDQVKSDTKPKATCISMLANLAEVCARFSSLETHNDGLKGCLQLEPKLLGDIQTRFNIGCFSMGPEGMKLDETINSTLINQSDDETSSHTTQSDSESFNEEELAAVVNESAQQGLAFFENLLGLSFGKDEANKTSEADSKPTQTANTETPKSELARKARLLPSKLNLL